MSSTPTSCVAATTHWPSIFVRLLFAIGASLNCAWIAASDLAPTIDSVQVGFRNVVEVGRNNPIRVSIHGHSSQPVHVRIVAADVEGRSVRYTTPPISVDSDETTVNLVYQHGPLQSPVIVELVSDGRVVASQSIHESATDSPLVTMRQNAQLILCLGANQIGFEEAARLSGESKGRKSSDTEPLVVQHYSPEQFSELPRDIRAWDSVDAVVISADCEIPTQLGDVLNQWVRRGGRLVLTGGEDAITASSTGLKSWLPIQADGNLNQRDLSSLKMLVQGGSTLRLLRGSIKTVRWSSDSGEAPAQSQDGPIVVRAAHGQGIVSAIALDLNSRPFVSVTGDRISIEWESLPDLCRWLAGLPKVARLKSEQQRPQSDLNPTGVSDLQTQLVNALDQFPDLQRPSYWVVLGSALLFLTLVGPLDWLLVHRVLKRPHWTWITLPLWIVLGTGIGLLNASRVGGTKQLSRQVDMLTWDSVQGESHFAGWLALTSPTHHRYSVKCRVSVPANSSPADAEIRWSGRPEMGFRGLYRESEQIGSGASLDLTSDHWQLSALPIRHGDSAVIETHGDIAGPAPFSSDFSQTEERHLRGTVSHQLTGELVDWVIGYGGFAYLPPADDRGVTSSWKSGETIDLKNVQSRLLGDYLGKVTSRSVARKDGKSRDFVTSRSIYDPLDKDLYDLLKTVSFNQLTGGKSYTGLDNHTLQKLDLSELVTTQRVVLFGRLVNKSYFNPNQEEAAGADSSQLIASYSLDGNPLAPQYRECFVRVILPLKPASRESPAPP